MQVYICSTCGTGYEHEQPNCCGRFTTRVPISYTPEWFHNNADANPRRCIGCSKSFSVKDDYPWFYFRWKKNVQRNSHVNTCSNCHAYLLLKGARDELYYIRVLRTTDARQKALFRSQGRNIDKELQSLIAPAPPYNPAS